MPQWNQVTGSFGSERQLIEQALVSLTEWMHQMGDPTQGRLPQTSQRHHLDLSSLIHPAVQSGRQAVFQAIRDRNAGYSPTHSSIAWGGPHPEWWGDPDAGAPGGGGTTTGTGGTASSGTAGTGTTTSGSSGGLWGAISDAVKLITSPASRNAANDALTVYAWASIGAFAGLAFGGAAFRSPAGAATFAGLGYAIGALYGVMKVYSGHPIHFFFPSDEGGGGPRSNAAARYLPDPETGSGGGPRGYSAMPDPESGSGGGPKGIAASPTPMTPAGYWFPDPEGAGSGGPRT